MSWPSSVSRRDLETLLMPPLFHSLFLASCRHRITFSIHDSPSLFIPYARQQELVGLAEKKARTSLSLFVPSRSALSRESAFVARKLTLLSIIRHVEHQGGGQAGGGLGCELWT